MKIVGSYDLKDMIIDKMDEKQSVIYVLKGFADLCYEDYPINKLLTLDITEVLKTNTINEREVLDEVLLKLRSNNSFVISYEEYVICLDKLINLIVIFNYKIIILNDNLYYNFYPAPAMITKEELNNISSEKDNNINKVYNDYVIVDDSLFIEYVGLDLSQNTINLMEKNVFNSSKREFELVDSFSRKIYYLDSNEEGYLHFLNEIYKLNDEECLIASPKEGFDFYQNQLLYVLANLGYKIKLVKRVLKRETDKNVQDYEAILKRKNPSYRFKNIRFYKNPGFSLETEEISQAEIVSALVNNALLAKDKRDYNDIFVTAPTGSGKSILFQIPAIFLSEKYNLFTIIITPLIGLMKDQIQNIESMTNCAATINSEYTPKEKDIIREKIINKEISILYVSPETLLSNNPINNLIGDREIGLFVIDESHIVSTWGKTFRPDYWFLGDYISYLRTKQGRYFPIATFSATVTYGGNDDMHGDIIDSLKMKTGEYEYIAPMRRDDIKFDVSIINNTSDYLKDKEDTVIASLGQLMEKRKKTVAYFPYTRQVEDFYRELLSQDNIVKYHGKMFKQEKDDSLHKFRDNKANMILATKAFGMGIDIDDIEVVYHYAPTGNLCDYVQEIGRAARNENIQGLAKTDFFKHDFRYIKQLFGMSSIKNYQIVETLKKLSMLYSVNKKRNFTISPDDFSYIFPNAYSMQDVEVSLKTTMLMIQKDFEKDPNTNFKPIIFKPRSLFTRCYFLIKPEDLKRIKKTKYYKYFHLYSTAEEMSSKYIEHRTVTSLNRRTLEVNQYPHDIKVTIKVPGNIYSLDLKKMWEENYNDYSFANFKRLFFEGELPDFKISKNLIQEYLLTIETRNKTFRTIISIIEELFREVQTEFSKPEIDRSQLTISDIAKVFESNKSIRLSRYESMIAAENFVELINKFTNNNSFGTNYVFKKNTATNKFTIFSINLMKKRIKLLIQYLNNKFANVYNGNKKLFLLKSYEYRKAEDSKELMIAQVLEMFKLATYQVVSGERPEYFIRINSINKIESILKDDFYQSKMVRLVRYRHEQSIQIMDAFFMTIQK